MLSAVCMLAIPLSLSAQPLGSQSAIKSLKEPLRTRVTCSVQAAVRYALPANLMIAIAEQEGGGVGQWVQNKNGSYDVGPMQFNTTYLTSLARFGITPEDVAADGCYPYELAAWRLRRHLDRDDGDILTRAANYHSRTPIHNARYRAAIGIRAATWARWLSSHAPTIELTVLDVESGASSPSSKGRKNRHVAQLTRVNRPGVHNPKQSAAPGRVAASADKSTITQTNVIETLAAIEAHRREQLLMTAYAWRGLSSDAKAAQVGAPIIVRWQRHAVAQLRRPNIPKLR